MSMPHIADEPWTVARWRELEFREGERYEVIEGELVVTGIPALRHARAVAELARPVDDFVRAMGIGAVYQYWAPVFLNEYNVYLPDFIVSRSGATRAADWEELGMPMLVVEVLSPSSAKYDRGAKRQRYQGAGVDEYWIVDLDARLIERWRRGDARPEVLRDALTWQPVGVAEPLTLDLKGFFTRVVGD
ncbi:MAG: Uma2 family endonuclease [Gemmatimonadetes bacterium]|nr:Uma2 family endonuclease [Gemmatimonadota bacterium]